MTTRLVVAPLAVLTTDLALASRDQGPLLWHGRSPCPGTCFEPVDRVRVGFLCDSASPCGSRGFLNHGGPQSYTEGFDGWFEMPQPDPGEGSYRIARWSKTPGSGRPKTNCRIDYRPIDSSTYPTSRTFAPLTAGLSLHLPNTVGKWTCSVTHDSRISIHDQLPV
jgi:hypothetical protein